MIQRTSRFAGPVFFVYAVALVIGTHLPGSAVQGSISGNDKILHFSAYAVLSLLAFNFMLTCSVGSLRCFLALFFSLAVFAALDELTQIPIPGRFCEWGDWWANLAGISVSLAAATCLVQNRRSRLAPLRRLRG
jgi:VanZ family protein